MIRSVHVDVLYWIGASRQISHFVDELNCSFFLYVDEFNNYIILITLAKNIQLFALCNTIEPLSICTA